MKNTEVNQTHEKSWVRVALVLLFALAVCSSAMKELNQAKALVTEIREVAADVLAVVTPKDDTGLTSNLEICSVGTTPESGSKSDDLLWNGRVAPGVALELTRADRETIDEPEIGGEADVASRTSGLTDMSSIGIRVVEPTSDLIPGATHSTTVRNMFTVRVRSRAVGRAAGTDILSAAVTSAVVSRVVKGLGGSFESKAIDEARTLLPSSANIEVTGEPFINSDCPVKLANLARRKSVSGKIRVNGRVFVLRGFNANTNYRPAS